MYFQLHLKKMQDQNHLCCVSDCKEHKIIPKCLRSIPFLLLNDYSLKYCSEIKQTIDQYNKLRRKSKEILIENNYPQAFASPLDHQIYQEPLNSQDPSITKNSKLNHFLQTCEDLMQEMEKVTNTRNYQQSKVLESKLRETFIDKFYLERDPNISSKP